jgi:hypothetical protein
MAVDERSRHELYRRLDEVLGSEAATTLIEHLPPVGWADVATKNDLRNLEERLELRFDRIDDRFGRVEDRFAAIDGRFDRVDDRFAAIDDRFDRVDDRFAAIDDRFDRVDDRFAAMEERFDRVDDRFAAVEERMGLRFDAMGSDLRASFEHELRTQTTTMIFALVGVVLTMAGLAFALARFT